MSLSLLNKSNYYKGLLVLLRRDRIIDPREKDLLLELGSILDFDRRFCEVTIDELLTNRHISRDPILFSDAQTKECFFRDALRLAMIDGRLHPLELRWLRTVARANNMSDEWLNNLILETGEEGNTLNGSPLFEIQRYL